MSSEWPAPFQPIGPPPPPAPTPPSAPSRRSQVEWFLAGGIVVAGIVAVIFIALNLCPTCFGAAQPTPTPTQIALTTPTPTTAGVGPTAGGTGSPGPSPTTPAVTASPAPTDSLPADVRAKIEEVLAQVPAIRELQPLRDVSYHVVSRGQFQADLQQLFDENTDLTLVAAQERFLKRLGLLPTSADLRQLFLELSGGAVAAYYRFDTRELYVIDRGEPFGATDQIYVAHEYTHALQDQHFDVAGNQIKDPAEGDAAISQLAVLEGDATTAMFLWAGANLSLEEFLEIASSALNPVEQQMLDDMPLVLSRQLTFPYEDGFNFTFGLQQQSGWAAVNDAIRDPPASTEQIMHPEKFAAHEVPVAVSMPDVADQLGAGWQRVYLDTLGELNVQILAAGDERRAATLPGMPVGDWPHAEAAAGWGGDRVAMWEEPEGADWAIAWKTAWDSAADADEFAARVGELQSRFGGETRVTRTAPDAVVVLIATGVQILDDLEAALGQ